MRQQFIKAAHGMFGDAAEHISEPGKRVGFRKFAGRNEAAQHSRGLAAVVAAEEGPVAAANSNVAIACSVAPLSPYRGSEPATQLGG